MTWRVIAAVVVAIVIAAVIATIVATVVVVATAIVVPVVIALVAMDVGARWVGIGTDRSHTQHERHGRGGQSLGNGTNSGCHVNLLEMETRDGSATITVMSQRALPTGSLSRSRPTCQSYCTKKAACQVGRRRIYQSFALLAGRFTNRRDYATG